MKNHHVVNNPSTEPIAMAQAFSTLGHAKCGAAAVFLSLTMQTGTVAAQGLPITAAQREAANQVAQRGVALSDLKPQAPEKYTVKRGDTLWGISTLYLTSPWRWPELWGMNLTEIRNPHRIYPGQVLVLDKSSGRAVLRVGQSDVPGGDNSSPPTVKVSPRTRYETLADSAIASLSIKDIEPFLAQPLVLTAQEFANAPRIVATQEGRVLLSKGDTAYARQVGSPLTTGTEAANRYRIVRSAKPLIDPDTGLTLGLEAEYVGQAELIRSESTRTGLDKSGKSVTEPIPATLEIIDTAQEARTLDRLVREPEREFLSFVPRAPSQNINARIVAVYGSGVSMVSTNQVLVINRGSADGLERGHVLALMRDGDRVTDKTIDGKREPIKLPDERNGLMMIFKAFDRLAYGLVLSSTDALRVGDRLVNPR